MNAPYSVRLPAPLHHEPAVLRTLWLARKAEVLEIGAPNKGHVAKHFHRVGRCDGRIDLDAGEGADERPDGVARDDGKDAGFEKRSSRCKERGAGIRIDCACRHRVPIELPPNVALRGGVLGGRRILCAGRTRLQKKRGAEKRRQVGQRVMPVRTQGTPCLSWDRCGSSRV